MARQPYPTDLTARRWRRLEPDVPAAKPGGRPRGVDLREGVEAILDVLRNGGGWRALPLDFPPWQTVSHDVSPWRKDGTWDAILTALREDVRLADGRAAPPRAAIRDRQSV